MSLMLKMWYVQTAKDRRGFHHLDRPHPFHITVALVGYVGEVSEWLGY